MKIRYEAKVIGKKENYNKVTKTKKKNNETVRKSKRQGDLQK